MTNSPSKKLCLWICLSLILWVVPQSLLAQVTANFSANDTVGCSTFSLFVSFTDLSTGNPTSWQWSFGDNSTSTVQNPTHVYSAPGCYTVTLTASDGGSSNTLVKTGYICIYDEPTAGFTASATQGCAPLTVQFTDTSISNANSNVSWVWVLSNGDNSTLENPTFTFATPGTYSINLTVTNDAGCIAIAQRPNYITVAAPPVLDFTANTTFSCNSPLTVNFTNTTSSNGATGLSYEWLFPGGSPASSNQLNPPPVVFTNGSYDVTLISTSANGCEDTLLRPNFIAVGGVTAGFTANNTTVCVGDPVLFSDTSAGGVSSYGWDFDGNGIVDATTANPSFTYNTPGTYGVTLFANNPGGCGDTVAVANYITVLPKPVANFSVDDSAACITPATFNFTDLSTGAVAWNWDFGDGNTSNQQNPSHVYTANGDFSVCLIITAANGCQDTFCLATPIQIAPPNGGFSASPTEGCDPLTVQFTDQSVAPDQIVSWEWDFGGGTPATSTVQNPTATFAQGNYNITLIIQTLGGCTDTVVSVGLIKVGTPPIADFTVDKDTVCVNETLTFSSAFTNPGWSYEWDFMYEPDSSFNVMATTDSAIFAYPDTGLFNVALIIENNGCRDTMIKNDFVFASPPVAKIAALDSIVCGVPGVFTFVDSSTGPIDVWEWSIDGTFYSNQQNPPPFTTSVLGLHDVKLIVTYSLTGCIDSTQSIFRLGNPVANFTSPDTEGCRRFLAPFTNSSQNATSYSWRFGDNGTSGAINPNHLYQNTGLYTVTLIATDAFGCRDTLVRPDYISVIGPKANFAADTLQGCPPFLVQFSDSSTAFNTTITNWSWDFDDPLSGPNNASTLRNPNHSFNQAGTFDIQLTVTDNQGCQDSITFNNYVTVTFPEPDFSVDNDTTCSGSTINFSNLSAGVGLSYFWDFGDGTGTSTLPNPSYAYADTGLYTVTLVATDLNGCVDSIVKQNFVYVELFEANFSGTPTVGICPPLNTLFSDSTIGNAVSWQWDFGDGVGISFLRNPGYTYIAPGNYDVTLVATHANGCRDTVVKQDFVQLAGPNGNYVIDPVGACFGDSICLTITTVGADTITVDFDNGASIISQADSNNAVVMCYTYPAPGTYTPAVILEDAQGCQYALPQRDSVQIYRLPQAEIGVTDSIFCTPATIGFSDLTAIGDTAIVNWAWSFGDGGTATVANPPHLYDTAGVYTINLLVTDGYGCVDSTTRTVEGLEGTIANFVASDTFGCAPLTSQFVDLSTNIPAIAWEWSFGDNDSAFIQNPVHTYADDGLYEVTLVVFDSLGCSDTLTKSDYIYLRHPEAIVRSNSVEGCNPITLTFYADSSQSDTTIVLYEWCLTELTTGASNCNFTPEGLDSFLITFDEPGDFAMTLTVTDILGCSDTSDSLYLNIDERFIPDPIVIRRVSVTSDTSAVIEWDPFPDTDFIDYIVYRMMGTDSIPVAQITNRLTASFEEINPALDFSQNSYCYKVAVQNSCQEYSRLSLTQEHCTVDLTASSGLDAIDLTWTQYIGWPVSQYNIYRATSYAPATMQFIATVAGSVTAYTDTNTFCSDEITYRIEAVELGGIQLASLSDLSSAQPVHLPPTETVDITFVSVVNDSFITINWLPYTGYKPSRYRIEKSLDGQSWDSLATAPLNLFTIEDTAVEVDESFYFYRVFAVDSCGDFSAPGLFGRSILLNVGLSSNGKDPILNWTLYERWPNNVLSYEIEVLNDQTGVFELVDAVSGNVRNYTDTRTRLNQATYCYRITAIEAGGLSSRSTSNEDCVTFGPQVFVPSAFSPNGDGHNDEFIVAVPNLRQATLIIFNRWGEAIYRSNDMSIGWDGTYKEKSVQEGVYVFMIEGIGVDGSNFRRSGTVTLIR